jgi:hypothetical protein
MSQTVGGGGVVVPGSSPPQETPASIVDNIKAEKLRSEFMHQSPLGCGRA